MTELKPIRRDQLQRFIPDQETILRFQKLFETVGGGPSTGGLTAIEYLQEQMDFYIMTRSID